MHPGVRAALHRRNIPGAGQRHLPHRERHPEVALTQIIQRHVAIPPFHLQLGLHPQAPGLENGEPHRSGTDRQTASDTRRFAPTAMESGAGRPFQGPSPEVHRQVGNSRTAALISPAASTAISAHYTPDPQVQAQTAASPIWIRTGVRGSQQVHRSNLE